MPSSPIRSRLKKKLLRRNRGESEDSSVKQGILSTLPTNIPAILDSFRALPLGALGRGRIEDEDNGVNQ